MFVATQRPALCAVDVRSAANVIYCFEQGSENDLDAIETTISRAVADRVSILQKYHCIRFTRDDWRAVELDAQRRAIAEVNTVGARAARARAELGLA
jgi:hypothetical protein